MIGEVAQLWRYPIKGIGAEPLESVDVTPERPFPLDRAWAILEEGGDSTDGWRSCRNFLRGAKGPDLMGATARVEGSMIHLSHPKRPDISVDIDQGRSRMALIDWIKPVYPADRNPPVAIVDAPDEGMADVPFASVSVMNLSSLHALAQKAGQELDVRRFRGNIWLDGLAPWEEFDLVGKTIAIGDARLEIMEPITRCRATEANPVTGQRDIQMLRVLEQGWGHTEFGVNASVRARGTFARGDKVVVL